MSQPSNSSADIPDSADDRTLSPDEIRRRRDLIEGARRRAESLPSSSETETHTGQHADTGTGHLEVRCPSCHEPVSVAVDTALTDLTCVACGSHFSLVDQSQATRMAPSLSSIGRFELIERIGVGGFGSVWKARDKQLDRTVAIKIPRRGDMSAEDQDKFFREARAAAQLRHPGIVSVHEVGRDGDSIYIVSDFIRGVTLGDWISGQKLTSREAAELCAKIADALHHAHIQKVIHRDLKPANIMIDGDGLPHLMDFGLARRDAGEVTVTMDGQVLGTPAYMSPEQAAGEAHTADCRSDVYSLGVILFQLLTGELPFRGNVRMLMHQVIHDEPPSPRKFNACIPQDLETITLKCLEKLPAQRYQSADALSAELRRYVAGEPIQARPLSAPVRLIRWAKRKPMMATTAALTVLLAIAGPTAALIINRQRSQLEERFIERDRMIDKYAAERKHNSDEIKQLRQDLDRWEGESNPWDFWPRIRGESPRQRPVLSLLDHTRTKLGDSLQAAAISGEASAQGYLALAILSDAAGRVSDAIKFYGQAREQLAALREQKPDQVRYARAYAECCSALARLSVEQDRAAANAQLESARKTYRQIAALEPTDSAAKIEWLEAELAAAELAGFRAGQEQLARVAEINRALPTSWPTGPAELYSLACLLTRHAPVLMDDSSDEAAEMATDR